MIIGILCIVGVISLLIAIRTPTFSGNIFYIYSIWVVVLAAYLYVSEEIGR